MKRALVVVPLAVATPARAHDAFGDLGVFYQSLLHPLADPAQGLVIAAGAVLLARQRPGVFRPAYLALVVAALVTLAVAAEWSVPRPGLRVQAVLVLVVALAALVPFRPGAVAMAAIAVVLGSLAALPLDPGIGARAVLQVLFGGVAGIALATLFLWGAIDWADRRISPLAGTVASAWVAAIGLMAAVLPV